MTIGYGRTARKGVTLTEMTVVLALVSIVSLLVVSFTVMVNVRSATAVTKNRVADDLRLSKVVLENWIETVNTYGADILISDEGQSLTATIDGTVYRAELTENGFAATLPNDEFLNCPIGEITGFTFEEMKRANGGEIQDAIWFCTAEYILPRSDGETLTQQTTFCINPHVGDNIGRG